MEPTQRSSVLAIGLVIVLASATLPATAGIGDDGEPGVGADPEPVDDHVPDRECTPHPPIRIDDDAQFGALGSGVVNPTANGTEEDPYVIEGWCIWNPQTERLQWRTSAILLSGTEAHVVIRENVVTPAPLRSPAAIVPAPNDYAVRFREAANVTFEDNELLGNSDDWVFKAGVFAEDSDGIVLRNNTIEDLGNRGVFLRDSRDVTVEANILENDNWGIYLTDTSDGSGSGGAVIRDNVVRSGEAGIVSLPAWSRVSGLTIRDNTLTGNELGIWLDWSDDVEIVDNVISDNLRGVSVSSASGIDLAGNNVEGNPFYGLSTERLDEPVDARGNWWGHRTGPSGDVEDACTGTVARGPGDEIRGDDVCFDPWLEAPNPDAGAP